MQSMKQLETQPGVGEERGETAILYCRRCKLLTRHRRQCWEERVLLIGPFRERRGWACTKCDQRR